MFVLAVASAGCNVPRPVSQGPGGDAQVWAGIQVGMLRFDLVYLEHLLPKAGLCSQRVLEGKEGWSWNVPILPGITTDGREREGPATASRLGTQRRNWLQGAHRGAATPTKDSNFCFCLKAVPAAASFKKAEPAAPRQQAPDCRRGFCS